MAEHTAEYWQLPCTECEQAMTVQGTRIWFEGDWSMTTVRLACRATGCQTSAEVSYRTFIPIDLAVG